jgi:hypothetical protein
MGFPLARRIGPALSDYGFYRPVEGQGLGSEQYLSVESIAARIGI